MNAKKRILLKVFKKNQGKFLNANDIFREAQKITGQYNIPYRTTNSLAQCLRKFHYTKKSKKDSNEATKYYCPSTKQLTQLNIKIV